MEATPRSCGNFDVGVKHKLFKSFRKFKEDNSVSKNDNAIKITPVEQQILQGLFINQNSLLEINEVLLQTLKDETLYEKFDDKYMQENPFDFFQGGLNLFFKNRNDERKLSDDELVHICKINGNIYIVPDDSYYYQNVILELSMLDLCIEYPTYRKLFLILFALAYKSGMFDYLADSYFFEMVKEEYENANDEYGRELDEEEVIEGKRYIKEYESGSYRKLMNEVKKMSKKEWDDLVAMFYDFYNKCDLNTIMIGDEIKRLLSSFTWEDLKFFSDFQHLTFQILDPDNEKYEDRRQHLMEYNTFQYEMSNPIEEYVNQSNDSVLNETWFQTYLIPYCFSKDKAKMDYMDTFDNFYKFLVEIITLERYVYRKYGENNNQK